MVGSTPILHTGKRQAFVRKKAKALDELSNVIKGHRARLGSMREKNDHKNSSPDNEQRTLPCLIFTCDSSQLFPVLGSQRSRCHKE